MTEIERLTTTAPVELRAAGGTNSRMIGGYASLFNVNSQNLGGFVERVNPSFFNGSSAAGWPGVVARYEHDPAFLLGATKNGTLQLSVDATGLDYRVDLPQTRSDVLELVQRGDVGNSSFAFQVAQDDWGLDGGVPLRTLLAGHLIDVAPVSSPAYGSTTVGLRSLAQFKGVDVAEVMALAARDELRKFFVRTDGPSTPRRFATQRHAPMTPVEALARLGLPDERRELTPVEALARLAVRVPTSGASAKVWISGRRVDQAALSGHAARARTLGKLHPKRVQV
jgi:uncharacterized protein